MLIKELFENATDYVDLQALIMFLVFEKQVLSMDDDIKKLDLYFLDKHRKRMNQEIEAYKKKMNMSYGLQVFKVKSNKGTHYIASYSTEQARYIANQNLIQAENVEPCPLEQLMNYEGKDMTLKTLIQNKKPSILGGNQIE